MKTNVKMYPDCFKITIPNKIYARNNVNTDGGYSLVKRGNPESENGT
jgi:hypothetical protein